MSRYSRYSRYKPLQQPLQKIYNIFIMIKYIFLNCSGVAAKSVFLWKEKSAVCDRILFFSGEDVKNAATAATAATSRILYVVFCSGWPLQPLQAAATNSPP
jgi:hypothetical protein